MYEEIVKAALRYLLGPGNHSAEFVKYIERLYRNETRHFKSGLFPLTWSAGMEATHLVYPYGWPSVLEFWEKNPQFKPIGIVPMVDNDSELSLSRGERDFIKFPDLIAGMMTVAFVLEKDKRIGAWFNHREVDETAYEQTLNDIIPHYTNEILAEAA